MSLNNPELELNERILLLVSLILLCTQWHHISFIIYAQSRMYIYFFNERLSLTTSYFRQLSFYWSTFAIHQLSSTKSNGLPKHTDRAAQALHTRTVGLNTRAVRLLSWSTRLTQSSCCCCCLSCASGSWAQLSSSQWTTHESHLPQVLPLCHMGYFHASPAHCGRGA